MSRLIQVVIGTPARLAVWYTRGIRSSRILGEYMAPPLINWLEM